MKMKLVRFNLKGTTVVPPSPYKLHPIWAVLPFLALGGIYALSNHFFHSLPDSKTDKDFDAKSPHFVESYAIENLKILNNIGSRLVGSEANEYQTIEFLTNTVKRIRSQSLINNYRIEFDIQTASGSYIIDDMVNVYSNIKNFIVRFSSPTCNSTSALLLNSHYDTVPESSGAGDDGTMVAVMLEILRVLSLSEVTLNHSLVFLFNGAEENSLQGSHAFITQHQWAKNVKAFINLDVAGLGGREMLFQSGPGHPWLMQHYYKSAIHPYASSIAEEIFQNNLIPSDTDFRIFRDYGKIPGLDLANSYNGYVYHTKNDRFDASLHRGSLQNTGDNILALVRSIASSEELKNPDNHSYGHTVFFDFLGLFLIFYTEAVGIAINLSIAVIAIAAMSLSMWTMSRTMSVTIKLILKKFGLAFLVQVAALILAVAVVFVLAVIFDAANAPLFWFTNSWLIFGVYFCPMVFVMAMIPILYTECKFSQDFPLRYGIQLFLHGHCVFLIILLIIMTGLQIRSAFAVTLCILFYATSVIINCASQLQNKPFLWLIALLVLQIIPFAFYSYLSQIIFTTFIPITGRSGCNSQPDIMIAAFTCIVGLLACGFLAPLFAILRKSKLIISSFIVIFLVFSILVATSVGFPFIETAPERIWVFHTRRTFHGSDAFSPRKTDYVYIVLPLDRYSTISIEDSLLGTNYGRVTANCSEQLVCGVPVYSPEFKPLSNYSYYLPGLPANVLIADQAKLELVRRGYLNLTIVRYEFEVSGRPAHMQIFFNPLDQSQLVEWSIVKGFPKKDYFQESTYFIHWRHGLNNFEPFRFYLDFQVPKGYSGRVFDIALIAHHNNYRIEHIEHFKKFLNRFREWTVKTPIVSSFDSFRYSTPPGAATLTSKMTSTSMASSTSSSTTSVTATTGIVKKIIKI